MVKDDSTPIADKWGNLNQKMSEAEAQEANQIPNPVEAETVEETALSYEDLKAQLQKETQRANDSWEKLLRLQADLDNFRRRAERDVASAHKYALEKFLSNLLPIVDSLEHSLAASSKEEILLKPVHEGILLTLKMFTDALKKVGVDVVEPQGSPFDPALHEAMVMEESQEVSAGTVIKVLQKGYLLNGRLLRPALVSVAK